MSSYEWLWLLLACLWGGLGGYWAGETIMGNLPLSVCLGMTTLSASIALSFLFAFSNSKKEVKND